MDCGPKNKSDIVRIKEEAERWLFDLPGVRGVGVGPKFVAGKPVARLAIQVFVESKRPYATLDPREVIPAFIQDIPTDVWAWGTSINTQQITVDDCPTDLIENANPISSGSTVTHLEIRSQSPHKLFENARVRLVGENVLSNLAFPVTIVDDRSFRIPIDGADDSPLPPGYVPNSASWINVCTLDNLCCCPTGAITFVSVAGDKITLESAGHGLLSGDRIKIRKSDLLLRPSIHEIQTVDANTFELVAANPAEFGGVPDGWSWRKVSIAPTGWITRIQMSHPVVITSAAHGLAEGDRVVIQTNRTLTQQRLDNHVDRRNGPYLVEIVDANRFALPEVDATSWGSPPLQADFLGSWIKVIEDFRTYTRKWGGIRIEMKESETESVERTPERPASSALSTTINPQGQRVHVEVRLGTGTLGCIAIDESTGQKVLLSNAHVLYSGTDNEEVHHPNYYTSSRSCSKHKIAVRDRQVFGEDPGHPDVFVDAAIARLDAEKGPCDPFIADIGPVQGTAPIQSEEELKNGDYRVWKRGAQTGITEGILISCELTVADPVDGIQWRHQLQIQPLQGVFRGFMSIRGDSGSVVVNKENKIVGLISKAQRGGFATANRIQDVERALGVRIWKVGDPPVAGEEPVEPGQGQAATVGIPVLFAATLAELSASESGNQLAVIVQSHVAEAMKLVETNRKFATLWHRNHGPRLMQHLREILVARNRPMPAVVEGQSLKELLTAIFDALRKYGSAELAAHVGAYEQFVLQLLTHTYDEMLQILKAHSPVLPKA